MLAWNDQADNKTKIPINSSHIHWTLASFCICKTREGGWTSSGVYS